MNNTPEASAVTVAEGVGLWRATPDLHGKLQSAVRMLDDLNHGRGPRPVHQKLKSYRESSALLIKQVAWLTELNQGLSATLAQAESGVYERARKRWTPEEDVALIDFLTQDDEFPTMVELTQAFHRSPGAISSRVSHLVGVRRLTQEVQGRITGYIDGVEVDGNLVGTLHRQA